MREIPKAYLHHKPAMIYYKKGATDRRLAR